jgi:hypothetical protein
MSACQLITLYLWEFLVFYFETEKDVFHIYVVTKGDTMDFSTRSTLPTLVG